MFIENINLSDFYVDRKTVAARLKPLKKIGKPVKLLEFLVILMNQTKCKYTDKPNKKIAIRAL